MPATAAARSRPLALVVDDDADTREMYAFYLNAEGIEVIASGDDDEAFEKATTLLPDIIATDLGLTNSKGVELCQRLTQHYITETIPIIAVTGRAMPREVLAAFASGCVSVLVKPCLPEDLLSEIRRVLDGLARTPSKVKRA